MDERILKIIDEKINSSISNGSLEEVKAITNSLRFVNSKEEFALGLVIGRVYNSFYYQTRRLLNRNPSKEEFDEFIAILEQKYNIIRNVIRDIDSNP